MKYISVWGVALVALLSSGCHAQDQNAAAFAVVAKNVIAVKNVVVPGDGSLDAKLTSLGGYPVAADVAVSKKATDTQYSIGYDASHKAIVAVGLDKSGVVTVVTDPDLVGGYAAKVKTLSGDKSSASTASSGGSGGPSGSPSASGGIPRGCPVKLGDSKAVVRKKLGSPDMVADQGTDHEAWHCHPLQGGQVVNEAAGSLIAGIPFGGGIVHDKVDNATKTKFYLVHFSGDSVASVEILQF